MSTTTAVSPTTADPSRLAGTRIERLGWVLPSLLGVAMTVFGLQTLLLEPDRDMVITGSACCNGHTLGEYTGWQFDYLHELARYQGSFMATSGLLFLVLLTGAVRRGRRWAWVAAWLLPVLFAVHAFVLGAFPFDAVTTAISATGLLLMIRPVFHTPR